MKLNKIEVLVFFSILYMASVVSLFAAVSSVPDLYEEDRARVSRIEGLREDDPVNVLSIDGGGVRGIIPAVFLQKLEKETGKKVHELFDLTAGTSTGAILSLGLNTEKIGGGFRSSTDMVRIYKQLSKEIFPPTKIYLKPIYFLPSSLWWGSEYSEKPLERELNNTFGDIELRSLIVPTVVTSVNLQDNTLKLFRSYRATWKDEENFFVRDVARATSAAPTFFPMKKIRHVVDNKVPRARAPRVECPDIKKELSLVDGGMAANNPSIIALSEAYNLFGKRPVNLISLSTGNKATNHHKPREYAYVRRAKPTIETLFDSQSDTVHSTLDNLSQSGSIGLKYIRIKMPLEETYMDMDNAHNVDILSDEADKWFSPAGAGDGLSNLDYVTKTLTDTLSLRSSGAVATRV